MPVGVARSQSSPMPTALWALTIGAFGIGCTEFVIGGLLPEVAHSFAIGIPQAGWLAGAYALGVFIGAPLLTVLGARLPRKAMLIGLVTIFTVGNVVTAAAPSFSVALIGRVITALNHGAYFGIGSILAGSLVEPDRRAGAIAFIFAGMAVANLIGVPGGTWLAQIAGWRAVFWVITAIGVVMILAVVWLVPRVASERAMPVRQELRTFADPRVLLAMGITVLGPAAFFTVITYMAPIATQAAGFSDRGVTGLMLLFGLGLVIGNRFGGRFADRNLFATLWVTLGGQGVVLVLFWFFAAIPLVMEASVFAMAALGFASVSPIQKLVVDRARTAGAPTLAASVNIGMFNLGNAIGAWIGGLAIGAGLGITAPILAAAALSFAALGLSVIAAFTPQPAP